MKVLHVVTDTDRRGAQLFACDLSTALEVRGHDSSVVALAPGTVGGLGLPVVSRRRRDRGAFVGIREAMKQVDVTVAHGSSTLLVCAVGSLGTRSPFVARQISETRFWAGTPARRLRVASYLRVARTVVALSASAARDLQDVLWVEREKIAVVPNGVPPGAFQTMEGAAKARAEFLIPADRVVVGYVGALAPEKGVDLAIEAVASRPDAHLLVVGDGPDRRRLADLATGSALGRVTFAGSLASPERCFAAMDVVVLPSRGGDSMPAVLIEAGMSGLPSVTTDVGSISEIVVDGLTGRVVAPGDGVAFANALHSLLDDEALRRAFGRSAKLHCTSRFDIDVVAAQWDDVLVNALPTLPSRRRSQD